MAHTQRFVSCSYKFNPGQVVLLQFVDLPTTTCGPRGYHGKGERNEDSTAALNYHGPRVTHITSAQSSLASTSHVVPRWPAGLGHVEEYI